MCTEGKGFFQSPSRRGTSRNDVEELLFHPHGLQLTSQPYPLYFSNIYLKTLGGVIQGFH